MFKRYKLKQATVYMVYFSRHGVRNMRFRCHLWSNAESHFWLPTELIHRSSF